MSAADYALRAVEASRRASRDRARHHAESVMATADVKVQAAELLPEIRKRYQYRDTPAELARRRREIA